MLGEPFIKDSTPKSSVILAYGESSRRGDALRILILSVLALALVAVLFGIGRALFGGVFPAPSSPALMLVLPASARIPIGSPDLWRTAQQESAPFPAIVGYSITPEGTRAAFAITPRRFSHPHATRSWLWQLTTEEPVDVATTRLTAFTSNPFSARWLRMWPARLLGATPLVNTADASIGGKLDERRWQTDLSAPILRDPVPAAPGTSFVNLQTLPNAWPFIEAMLREQAYDVRLEQTPGAVGWTVDSQGALAASLVFAEEMSLETKARLAAAAGVFEMRTRALADGTESVEFNLPLDLLRQSSSTLWSSPDGRRVIFSPRSAVFGDATQLTQSGPIPSHCQGNVLAAFDRSGLKRLLLSLDLNLDLEIERLVWTEDDGRLTICWE